MRYKEGDKVEIIDQSSEFYKKRGNVLTTKIDDKVWISFPPHKSNIYGFNSEQIKLLKSSIRGQEIEPSGCCVSSNGYISAFVFLDECPTKRQLGLDKNECVCINNHWGIPMCNHYKGLREVIRGGRKVWRVFCDAVEV